MTKKKELSPLDQALDSLIPSIKNQKDFDEVYLELRKRLLERMLNGELKFHLGYDKSASGEKETDNRRNGSSLKTVQTDQGEFEVHVTISGTGSGSSMAGLFLGF